MRSLKPFLSLLIISGSMMGVVYAKMEVRREGYEVLVKSRVEAKLRDETRNSHMSLAKMIRPQRVQLVAQSRLTLRRPGQGQIIQMTEQGIALRQ